MAQPVTQLDEPERKLAALMAADVVGFSRMMGSDETGTIARLEAARRDVIDPLLRHHRGRIFKVMGDGALIEFPSVVLALRAAVAVQEGLAERNAALPPEQRIVLRMGVHQADVVVQGSDLLGEGVNLAARLERLSDPGGICISDRVREDAEGKVALELRDGGEQLLRNIGRPVHVFHVLLRHGTAEAPASRPRVPAASAPAEYGRAGAFHPRTVGRADDAEAGAESDRTIAFVPGPSAHKLVLLGPEFGEHRAQPHGRDLFLGQVPMIVGRILPSDVILPGDGVSRAHCRMELIGAAAWVTDLNSTNGTFVDDQRIDTPTRLRPGALIRIGPHVLRYVRLTTPALVDVNATTVLPTDEHLSKVGSAG